MTEADPGYGPPPGNPSGPARGGGRLLDPAARRLSGLDVPAVKDPAFEGKVVDARYIKGDEALKTSATGLVGMSGTLKLPEGPALTLLRRGALTCRADGKCSLILYLPDDIRSID